MNALFDRIEGAIAPFLEDAAPVMRWTIEADDRPWIDKAFADRFPRVCRVELEAPVGPVGMSGFALAAVFAKARASDVSPQGPWRMPPVRTVRRDADALLMLLGSYVQDVTSRRGQTLVTDISIPFDVKQQRALGGWWTDLLKDLGRTGARVIVFEPAGLPSPFEHVGAEVRGLVRHERRAIGVPEALEAYAEAADGKTTEGQLRVMLLRTMHACKRGDGATAHGLARAVTAIASELGRPDLAVPAWFSLGALAMSRAEHRVAVEHYRQAEQLAERAVALALPTSPALHVQSRMGTGAALFGAAGYELAAKHFMETVPIAHAANEVRLEVECARLAGEAFVFASRYDKAFESGVTGMKTLARVTTADRPRESAGELGRFLLRVTGNRAVSHHRLGVEQQLDRLLGAGWNRTA